MPVKQLEILVADDDDDDHMLLREALKALRFSATIGAVKNGEQLMSYLIKNVEKRINTDILFLDLNMPLKSGIECLSEIKLNSQLQNTWIVILSTIADSNVMDNVFQRGAHYFIQKPSDFRLLEKALAKILSIAESKSPQQPLKKDFLLTKEDL